MTARQPRGPRAVCVVDWRLRGAYRARPKHGRLAAREKGQMKA